MHKVNMSAIGVAKMVLLGLFFAASPVHAQEIANPATTLSDAADGTGESPSFSMEANITWYEQGESDSYEMSFFEGNPETSSTSSSSVASSQNAVQTGGGGGRPPVQTRPSVTVRPAAPATRSSAKSATSLSRVRSSTSSSSAMSRVRIQQRPSRVQPPHRPSRRSIRQEAVERERLRGALGETEHDPCLSRTSEEAMPPLWFAITGAIAIGVGRNHLRTAKKHRQRAKRRKEQAVGHAFCLIGVLCLAFAAYSFKDDVIFQAHAADTVPQIRIYNGNLRSPGGAAITTAHTIRFSYWNTSDVVTGDATATGSINTSAPAYLGWYEEHTVTPNANGAFSVKLGSIRAIDLSTMGPENIANLHLQVEVKPAAMPDSAYELIDVKPSDPLLDRTQIAPVPYARNADLLDFHDVGTSSGSIPVLGSGGLLPRSTIPGGTNADTFAIDANGSSTAPALQFGNSLSKTISYDTILERFNFSDDLRIEGNLTVTGLINGVDVTNLTDAANTHLKVSSGAGLSVNIAGGNYRMGDSTITYAGATGVAVADNVTNYVFFGSGGLQIRTGGFPTDENAIQLAIVITSGGNIQSVQDQRVFLSDTREQNVTRSLTPAFEGAAYKADGTDNIGQLSILYDDAIKSNYYGWTSTRPTLQDYDIAVAVTLPQEFVRWQGSGALSVTYRTSSALSADNAVDVALFDTTGTAVSLTGATDLVGTAWTTTTFSIETGTWTANGTYLIRLRVKAKDLQEVHIGGIRLGTVSLIGS